MKVVLMKDEPIFMYQVPAAKAMIACAKEEDFDWYLSSMSGLVAGYSSMKVLEKSAKIARNCRVCNYYGEDTGDLDIWIECIMKDGVSAFYEIGAYMSDLHALDGDNREEILSRMYVREYVH